MPVLSQLIYAGKDRLELIEFESLTSHRLLVSLIILDHLLRLTSFVVRDNAPASSMASYLSNFSTYW
jgi:hypothetical protein